MDKSKKGTGEEDSFSFGHAGASPVRGTVGVTGNRVKGEQKGRR